tara:strand:+ start:94 stop:825 length:732 start_codon:yes stop_codon:yes gene_type:complete
MFCEIKIKNKKLKINLKKPIDISIPVKNKGIKGWGLDFAKINYVKNSHFIGNIKKGGSVNFNNIFFNPHSHGTHTESIAHVTNIKHYINDALKNYFFYANLISVKPKNNIITKEEIKLKIKNKKHEALIIRTLPNHQNKKTKFYKLDEDYTYFEEDAIKYIVKIGVKHLLVDFLSIDKIKDEGKLRNHKLFWGYPKNKRLDCTITELIFIENKIKDGEYILNLQTASFVNDAAPSRPIIYKIY